MHWSKYFLGLIYGQGSTAFSLTSLLRVIHTLPSLKKAAVLSLRSATLLNYQNSLLERSKASFFCFNGIGSGIDVKHGLDKWPFSRDFSFWSSFYVNNYIDDADVQPMDRACLFNMVADNKEGICIYFRGRELRIKVVSSNYSTVSVGEGNKLLDPKTWYTIGVVAVRPRFMGKSSVIVYLNGEIYFQGNLPFVHPRTRVDRCTFGENMNGKMGPTLISNENSFGQRRKKIET